MLDGAQKRDPARIDRLLDLVWRCWTKNGYDDFRLIQLLIAAASRKHNIPPIPELYYIEDDILEEALWELFESD